MPPRGPKKVEPGNRVPMSVFMYDRHRMMLDELDVTLALGRSAAIRWLIAKEWNAQKRRRQSAVRKATANE